MICEYLLKVSAQEVFDQVCRHAATMKRQSRGAGSSGVESCVYRAPDGGKCFAGCLISDDEYDAGKEKYLTLERSWKALVDMQIVPGKHQNLIVSLQSVHDHYPLNRWRLNLMRIASNHNLDAKILHSLEFAVRQDES